MNIFTFLTPFLYWMLIIIWAGILVFYIKKYRTKIYVNKLCAALLIVLAIDAFRTLFESLYFAAWYTSLSGMIPKSVHTLLVRPELVFIPKSINLIAALFIVFLIIKKWIPAEAYEREKQEKQLSELKDSIEKRKEAEEELGLINKSLKEAVRSSADKLITTNKQLSMELLEKERITEEKDRLQAQLIQVQKMNAIGALAGGIAHDFNNILCSIRGYTSLIIEELESDNPVIEDLEAIKENIDMASNLTKQLLLFSSEHPIKFTALDINQLITRLLKMIKRIIGEDINVETDFDDDLNVINGDRTNLEQVIMNLVINARDAMPAGGILKIITKNINIDEEYAASIPNSIPGEYIYLEITDNGMGIENEIIERIFDPFFTTKEKGKGTGLGLSVIYGIVNKHGGWINVYSEKELGTTFKLYFPIANAESVHVIPKQLPLTKSITTRDTSESISILLVEDDIRVRDITTRILCQKGYEVFTASTAKYAIKLFKKHDINIVFSDTILPDKNGLSLIQELLELKPDTKALLSSGYSNEKIGNIFLSEESINFIQKPYDSQELITAINKLLS